MKKNIKIIILSILMIFVLGTNVFASMSSSELMNMNKDEIKNLSKQQISVETIQEYIDTLKTYREDQKNWKEGDNPTTISEQIILFEKALLYKKANNAIGLTDHSLQVLPITDLKDYVSSLTKVIGDSETTNIEKQKYAEAQSRIQTKINERTGVSTDPLYGEFNYKDYNPSAPTNYTKATEIAGNILAIVRNIGIVIAFISLTLIGVKYMLGSVEEKASYKKSMIPFVVGLVLFVAVTTFISVIYNIVSGIF